MNMPSTVKEAEEAIKILQERIVELRKPAKRYKPGSRFCVNTCMDAATDVFILAQVDAHIFALISLSDGNRLAKSFRVIGGAAEGLTLAQIKMCNGSYEIEPVLLK